MEDLEQHAKVHALRDLIALAKQLRESAATTDDGAYIDLFLRAAAALEERANALAYGGAIMPLELRGPVNLVC